MITVAEPRGRRRVGAALVAALLYLGAIVWVPIAHAQGEVLHVASSVESGHSDDCAVIHLDIACGMAGMVQIQGTTSRAVHVVDDAQVRLHPTAPRSLACRAGVSLSHPVRGPPSY